MEVNEDGFLRLKELQNGSLPSIIFAGDLCPRGTSARLLAENQVDKLFPEIIPILRATDAAVTNLECPLTLKKAPIIKSGAHLSGDPACARGIRSAGFTGVSLANNHILDMGAEGLRDTLAACSEAGLGTVGAGENLTQASQPLRLEIKGLRVVLLAFSETEFSIARTDSPGACPVDPVNFFHQINLVKETADFILVMLHGGNEYYELPSPNMVKLCRYLVDLGVHAVICNHVHVPGGMEVYKGTPIIYSTGNFLFEWDGEVKEWYEGYLVKFLFQPGAVVELQLIPYWQSKDQAGVRLMDPSARKDSIAHINQLSSQISDPVRLMERWESFVRSKRFHYLGTLLSLHKVERRLLKLGVWPFWRLQRSAEPALLNLFTCDSHRDVVASLLSSELLVKKGQPDRAG